MKTDPLSPQFWLNMQIDITLKKWCHHQGRQPFSWSLPFSFRQTFQCFLSRYTEVSSFWTVCVSVQFYSWLLGLLDLVITLQEVIVLLDRWSRLMVDTTSKTHYATSLFSTMDMAHSFLNEDQIICGRR